MSRLGTLLEFDRARFDLADATRGSLVTAAIVAVPIAQGNYATAIPLSIGAAFTAVAEAGHPLGRRWRVMLWTTLWLMAAAALGNIVSDYSLIVILATAPIAFASGLAGIAGPRAAVIGLLSLVIFTIYAGIPVPLDDSVTTAALIGLGGIIQTAVCVVISLIQLRRNSSEPVWVHLKALQATDHPPFTLATLTGVGRPFLIHATRLTIVIVIATVISEATALPHQYWLPMSVAWMSKPDQNGTTTRVIHRIAGTALGLAFIGLADLLLRPGPIGFAVISLIGAAIAIGFIWVNYATAVIGVTIWVMGLFAMVGDPVAETMGLRLAATIAAATLVLLAFWLPTLLSRRTPAA
jgi:uncharacterized membrane protein YccC